MGLKSWVTMLGICGALVSVGGGACQAGGPPAAGISKVLDPLLGILLPPPSDEVTTFYRLAGLEPWLMEHLIGDLGIREGRVHTPKVVVVVYHALSCTHCADFHLKTLKPLIEKYGEGLCVIVRDRPLDFCSLQAAALTYCQPGKTHELQQALFAQQAQWMPKNLNLKPEKAHEPLKASLQTIAMGCGFSPHRCAPYLQMDTLKKIAEAANHDPLFRKIKETPLVYLYVPYTKTSIAGGQGSGAEMGYRLFHEGPIPMKQLSPKRFEALYKQARAHVMPDRRPVTTQIPAPSAAG